MVAFRIARIAVRYTEIATVLRRFAPPFGRRYAEALAEPSGKGRGPAEARLQRRLGDTEAGIAGQQECRLLQAQPLDEAEQCLPCLAREYPVEVVFGETRHP
ncbi:hypothetical protein D3C75_627690 [compost metagenome]